MTYTQPFENVYSHYPLKKGKFQAQKTWNKLNDEGALPDESTLIKAIHTQKKERTFLKGQNRFVPEWKHFSTWLNAGCVDDSCELQVARTPPAKRNGNGVDNMVRAYNLLKNVPDKFDEFCDSVGMSPGDKEAVLNKHNMSFNIKQLAAGIG